jgi:hypothetical protein
VAVLQYTAAQRKVGYAVHRGHSIKEGLGGRQMSTKVNDVVMTNIIDSIVHNFVFAK